MKKLFISPLALAIGLVLSTSAMAEDRAVSKYHALEKSLQSEYENARLRCDAYSGNTRDICLVQAKGYRNIARAELNADKQPTAMHHYEARVAEVESDYSVAIERCDDKAGDYKDLCLKEARTTAIAARQQAAAEKRSADYIAASESCMSQFNTARKACLDIAQARFGPQ